MKKIIFILILFLTCYFIHIKTKDNKIYYMSLGDAISYGSTPYTEKGYGYSDYLKDYLKENNRLEGYNKIFAKKDYRITDLINSLDTNKSISIDNKTITINQLISKSDIITLSIGMNELYYKLMLDNDNIYDYINTMMEDITTLFNKINKLNHRKILVLNYYNITNKNQDIFNYANIRLKQITETNGFEYVDIAKYLNNNPKFFINTTNFIPNNEGYYQIYQIIVEKIKKYWYNIPCNFITMTFHNILHVMADKEDKNEKRNTSKNSWSNSCMCMWGNIQNRINSKRYSRWSLLKMPSILYRKTSISF